MNIIDDIIDTKLKKRIHRKMKSVPAKYQKNRKKGFDVVGKKEGKPEGPKKEGPKKGAKAKSGK